MGITITAYGKHRGVTESAVRKAIKTGRISQNNDGTINPKKADIEWERNTLKNKNKKDNSYKEVPNEAIDTVNEVATNITSSGGTTLLQARTANEVLKAQTAKIKLSRLKNELIDRSRVSAHVFNLARSERESWLNFPARVSSKLSVELGVDNHKLHTLLEQEIRSHLEGLGEFKFKMD